MPKAQKHVLRPITVLGATRQRPILGWGKREPTESLTRTRCPVAAGHDEGAPERSA